MLAFQKPKQSRSQATLERLYAATVSLLEHQPFEAITVANIVDHANTSVGAFYKRFSSKRALLPALLDWIHRENQQRVENFVHGSNWDGIGLAHRVDAFVQALLDAYGRHHYLMKALVARQYSEDNRQSRELVESARWVITTYSHWLLECRDEIGHPEPEIAVPLGLTCLVQQIQTRLLFGATAIEVDQNVFVQELERALLAYLEVANHART